MAKTGLRAKPYLHHINHRTLLFDYVCISILCENLYVAFFILVLGLRDPKILKIVHKCQDFLKLIVTYT